MAATRTLQPPCQNIGFYATSLCRSDVRPKRAPLERTISKDKIRGTKRRPSIKLTAASTLAIKEALGLSNFHQEPKDDKMTLLSLPQETLCHIVSHLNPADISRLGQTCQAAHRFIVPENTLLWRKTFLRLFDDPKLAWSSILKSIRPNHMRDVEQKWNWFGESKRRWIALTTVHSDAVGDLKQKEYTAEDVVQTLLNILETAKTRLTDTEIARGAVPQIDDRSSLNLSHLSSTSPTWVGLESLIHDSHTPVAEEEVHFTSYSTGRPVTRSITFQRRRGSRTEAQSRLHVLYGQTYRDVKEHGNVGHARRMVYDWCGPNVENEYGPFKPDGSGEINWHLLEAVMVVISRNFEVCARKRIVLPRGFGYAIPHRTLPNPTVPEDWAGVTGPWVGTYSFLDYADLFHFNTWNDPGTTPTLEDVPEACGDLMRLELALDMDLRSDPALQSDLPRCDDLPVLYFSGTSRSVDSSSHPSMKIGIRGCASLCPGGREVRWRYLISYRGHDQWQLEGVQAAGLRSGTVYGVWTQFDHEEHAPVGAFMYVREELCKKQDLVLSRRRRDS